MKNFKPWKKYPLIAGELAEIATLIHDDIIDDSYLRRGNISIQAEFGKDVRCSLCW